MSYIASSDFALSLMCGNKRIILIEKKRRKTRLLRANNILLCPFLGDFVKFRQFLINRTIKWFRSYRLSSGGIFFFLNTCYYTLHNMEKSAQDPLSDYICVDIIIRNKTHFRCNTGYSKQYIMELHFPLINTDIMLFLHNNPMIIYK